MHIMILAIQRLEIETRERKDNNMRSCNITTPRTFIKKTCAQRSPSSTNKKPLVGSINTIYTLNYQQIYQRSPPQEIKPPPTEINTHPKRL